MKKNNILFYLMAAALSSITCTACQEEEALSAEREAALSFAPTVADISHQESVTRATTNNFFENGDEITIDIKTNRTPAVAQDKTYKYTDGVFNGKDANNIFKFSLDNTYIKTLTARWPSDGTREEGIVLDQRKDEDYQKSDRLIAHSENVNIMPTAEPVPLKFEHEQSRFSFRMAGQNANGLNILSIILELQYDDPNDEKGTTLVPGAFWAHCDKTEKANLILVPGIKISGKSNENPDGFEIVNGRYMIGMAEVGNETTKYTGGIWLKENVTVTLEPNHDYLVTLTPEGYNLIASIDIYGFGQNEGFIGIPSVPKQQND